MNIAIILIAGNGTRIKSKIPKQFIEVNNKPLFMYSLETFLLSKNIDHIILVTNKKYKNLTNDYVDQFNINLNKISIINGSNTRTESLKYAYDFISEKLKLNNDDVIITHDGARPLVSKDTINNLIKSNKKNINNVCTTYININDTISDISSNKILDRERIVRHLTPQSCSWSIFNKIFNSIKEQDLNKLTDLCALGKLVKLDIHYLKDSNKNIKITNDEDLIILKGLL